MASLPSCEDPGRSAATPSQPAGQETAAPEAARPEPPAEQVSAFVREQLGESPLAEELSYEDAMKPQEDGSFDISATLTLSLKEDLFTRENAPAAFNDERKAANEGINNAMLPESGYLVQVGAPTDLITEEDRAAKPLPENLKELANELKTLAEASVYRQVANAGQAVEVKASFKATPEGEGWKFTDLSIDNAALLALESHTQRSALPEGAPILTPEFEEARKAELRTKSAAFNEAAFPYIQQREEAARTRLVEYRAKHEEEIKRAAEQAEAEAAAREAWAQRCAEFIADGRTFSGEWTRDNRFGELSIHIARTMKHDNSLQFFGQLYDTKLPAASLDITGRCDLTQGGDKAKVDITIYDGQYDPDQPTAEVYDSSDSLMVLELTADGKLDGIMSCQSWKETPEKDFKVHLAPAKDKGRRK